MRKGMIIILLVGLLAASVFSTGCLEDAKKAISGEIVIKGTVETSGDTAGYGYAFIVASVVNGPAKVSKFKFKVENKGDDKVLEGNAGDVDVGGSIQFVDTDDNPEEATTGDSFIILLSEDCSGGEVKVYYDGDKVDEYDLA